MKDTYFYKKLYDAREKFTHFSNRQQVVPCYTAIMSNFAIKKLSIFDFSNVNLLYSFGPIKISKLAKLQDLKFQNMCRILNKLEELDLIEHFQKEGDRRSYYVRLNAKAYEKYKTAYAEFLNSYNKRIESVFSECELSKMNYTLTSIIQLYRKIEILDENNIVKTPYETPFDEFWKIGKLHILYSNHVFTNPPYEAPPIFKNANFSYDQKDALRLLLEEDRAVTMSWLAKKKYIKSYQATWLVEKPIRLDFIKRFKKNECRRNVFIELTQLGKELTKANEQAYFDHIMTIFNKALTDSELEQLLNHYEFLVYMFARLEKKLLT